MSNSTYIQNYGFTKTFIQDNHKKSNNEIEWVGDYDGNIANIQMAMNDNGRKEMVNMQLNNDDIMDLLGVQPVQTPLDKRLTNDFLYPLTNSNSLSKKKSRKHRTKRHSSHNSPLSLVRTRSRRSSSLRKRK
jgi:hypothetical protein